MKTLSEQYRGEARFAEEQSRKAFAEKNDALGNHMAGGASAFRHAAGDVEQLESTNAELTKRVAELERIVTDLNPEANLLALYDMGVEAELKTEALNRELRDQIADLQSQLAWTPVSAGLPTEPGWYVFHGEDEGTELLFGADQGESSLWVGDSTTYEWPKRGYTHYRRIELPKGGEP